MRYIRIGRIDIPVPSRNYIVGRLDIVPGLLGKVNREMAQLEEYCTATPYCDEDTMEIMELEFPEQVSPFLQGFLRGCAHHLNRVVVQDIRNYRQHRQPELTTEISVGPYRFNEGNGWHRDLTTPESMTYTLTLVGPTTEYATGSYSNSQFALEGKDDLAGPNLVVEHIERTNVGDVNIHDGTFTVHQAPPAAFEGYPRIFLNCVVDNIFYHT